MEKWEKPKLIVLVRSTPEEAVLNGCKNADASGPTSGTGNCIVDFYSCGPCDAYPAS
jgi:hypothetical protein